MSALWLVVVAERHLPLVPVPRLWRWLFPLRFILPAASNTFPPSRVKLVGIGWDQPMRMESSRETASEGGVRFQMGAVASRLRIGIQMVALALCRWRQ